MLPHMTDEAVREVDCIKLGKRLPGLRRPPFPNAIGEQIFASVSQEAWDQWLQESVRLINTYRVDLATKEGTEFLVKQLRIWFGFEDGELAATAWTPPSETKEAATNQ